MQPIDIIVTRHRPLVDLLIERGITTTDTPVIEHATAEDVRNKHVIGVLPHWLSSLAASVTEIPMRTTPADREAMARGDIGIGRMREIADAPVTYLVTTTTHAADGGRVTAALAVGIKHAAGPNGYGIKFLTNDHAAIIEIEDVDGWWWAQVDLYRGAVRLSNPNSTPDHGPWLDPMTREPWQMYRVDENGRSVSCMGYPTEEVEAKIVEPSAPDVLTAHGWVLVPGKSNTWRNAETVTVAEVEPGRIGGLDTWQPPEVLRAFAALAASSSPPRSR